MPTVAERSSITCTPSSLPATDRATRCAGAATAARGDVVRGEPRRLERRVPRRAPRAARRLISLKRSSHTFVRSSPGARQRSMNSSVTLAVPTSSATTAARGIARPPGTRLAASPPIASSALPASPVRASALTTSVGVSPLERDEQPSQRRARRRPEVERGRGRGEPQRGVDRGRVRLVDVCRVGGREEQLCRRRGRVAQREPSRFDAHRGGVLVESGDGTRALPAALPDEATRSRRGRAGGTGGRPTR